MTRRRGWGCGPPARRMSVDSLNQQAPLHRPILLSSYSIRQAPLHRPILRASSSSSPLHRPIQLASSILWLAAGRCMTRRRGWGCGPRARRMSVDSLNQQAPLHRPILLLSSTVSGRLDWRVVTALLLGDPSGSASTLGGGHSPQSRLVIVATYVACSHRVTPSLSFLLKIEVAPGWPREVHDKAEGMGVC